VKRRLAALLLAAAGPAGAAPPAQNLVVEMRLSAPPAAAPADGGFSVGTRGGTPPAPGSLTVQTAPADGADDGTQRLLVLNGARAEMHLRRLRALPTADWVVGGTERPAVGQTRRWVDLGGGFTVQPRWPGGHAPATVEIEVHGATAAHTTLALPLGEWVAFARRGEGLNETQLQLRVSLPPR